MSGCVTVTGPPASICALNFGTTEPFDASTLPNRTEIMRVANLPAPAWRPNSLSSASQYISASRLVAPSTETGSIALSVEIITMRGGAGRGGGVRDIDRAEYVGLDALVPVQLEHRHVLERGGVKHHVGLELRDQAHDPRAVANIGDAAGDFRLDFAWP